jgi:alkylated DNA repair dioxygenase AlkB
MHDAIASLSARGYSSTIFCDDGRSLIYLIPSLLPPDHAGQLFDELAAWPEWRTETDDFGVQGRKCTYFGDEGCTFAYVGLVMRPRPWLPSLSTVRKLVDGVVGEAHQCSVTGCLANNYVDGEGSIVWHCDEVRAHGEAKLVLALSLGGERCMQLRENASGRELAVRLPAGSALVMGGAAQEHWQHALPLDEADAPHRISLTLRSIVPFHEEQLEAAAAAEGRQYP